MSAGALAEKPDVRSLLERGLACHHGGQLKEAAAFYLQVLAVEPDNPDALNFLGVARRAEGDVAGAVALLKRAVALRPEQADIHNNLGNALASVGEAAAAEAAFRAAISLKADFVFPHFGLARLLGEAGRLAEAEGFYRQVLALSPTHLEAKHNLANALREQARVRESIRLLEEVVGAAKDLPEAHYNLALSHFMNGDLQAAGPHYEWRWWTKEFPAPLRPFIQPLWNGAAQPEATLLLHCEQGLGDTLQFIRFARAARALVGRMVIELPAKLRRVLKPFTDTLDAEVVSAGQPLPAFDCHAPLLSLPYYLGRTMATIEGEPYLSAEPALALRWKRLLQPGRELLVGLNWQGNPAAKIDRGRSLPLAQLAPLARLKGVRFVALQKGAGAEQVGRLPPEFKVESLGQAYDSGPDAFCDAAAVLANLDVVITTDTSMAHLAGAMGRPLFVILKKVPDWRWGLAGGASPWYPSAKLFRQAREADWSGPVCAMVEELATRLRNKETGT